MSADLVDQDGTTMTNNAICAVTDWQFYIFELETPEPRFSDRLSFDALRAEIGCVAISYNGEVAKTRLFQN